MTSDPITVPAEPYRLATGDWREEPRTIHGPDGFFVGGLEPDVARSLCAELNRLALTPPAEQPAPDVREGVARIVDPAAFLFSDDEIGEKGAAAKSIALDKASRILALIEGERAKVREALEVALSQAKRGADKAGCDGWRAQEMCRQIVPLIEKSLAALSDGGE